jgi:hypothetical protein
VKKGEDRVQENLALSSFLAISSFVELGKPFSSLNLHLLIFQLLVSQDYEA